MKFRDRYQQGLHRDGRVILWEHIYAMTIIPLVIGIFATRYWQTIWPTVAALVFGIIMGVWSWRQDLALHDRDDPDNNTVRDTTKTVPLLTKFYAALTVLLFLWIIRNWIVTGHY